MMPKSLRTCVKLEQQPFHSSARKYHERLHFVFECGWCELTSADCPDRIEPDADSDAA